MAAPFEKTLAENGKVRLASQYQLAAGIDDDAEPQLLNVDDAGNLKVNALFGLQLPFWDNFTATRYGSTNNLHVITFKVASTTVATLTLTYFGGGAADNDTVQTLALT